MERLFAKTYRLALSLSQLPSIRHSDSQSCRSIPGNMGWPTITNPAAGMA